MCLVSQCKQTVLCSGIMLSWSMNIPKEMADMASYQLYAYQESSQPPTTSLWKKVGDVKALPLPMACTLTQVTNVSHSVWLNKSVIIFSIEYYGNSCSILWPNKYGLIAHPITKERPASEMRVLPTKPPWKSIEPLNFMPKLCVSPRQLYNWTWSELTIARKQLCKSLRVWDEVTQGRLIESG